MTVPGLRRAIAQLVGNVPESLRIGGMPTEEPAPVFYSALERFIENNPTQRAPVSQWRGMIQNAPGIKAEEIDAVTHGDPDKWWRHVAFGEGLDDVGDLEVVGRHRITREAILNALRRDRVNLDERVAGGAPGAETENNRSDLPTRDEVVQRIEEDYMDEIDESARDATDLSFYNDYRSPRDEWEIIPHHPQDPPPRMIPRDRETGDLFGDPGPYRIGAGELPAPEDRQLQYWIAQQFRRNNLARNRQRAPDHTYQGRYDRPDEYEWGLPSEDSEFPSRYWNQRSARYRENAFGPFRTQEEAEAAMDELEEAHRDAARMDYDESDVYHRNWAEARDEYVNRYLGEDGYEYDEMDGGDVGVRWREWSMPGNGNGGTNYGEMVIRMPKNPLGGDFSYFHWPADENPIAHVRFHDRDVDGKRTLFIEEMQSDWHQKGREGGYKSPAAPDDIRAAQDTQRAALEALHEQYAALASLARQLPTSNLDWSLAISGQNALRRAGIGAVPDADLIEAVPRLLNGQITHSPLPPGEARDALAAAYETFQQADRAYMRAQQDLQMLGRSGVVENAPFKDNRWAELSMKRMIRWAADHGYDQIAWSGRIKNGDVSRGSDLPRGADFYDKVLNNITNGIVKKSGGRVKRVNMGFARPDEDAKTPTVQVGGGFGPATASEIMHHISQQTGSITPDNVPEGMRDMVREAIDLIAEARALRAQENFSGSFPDELAQRSTALSQRIRDAVEAAQPAQEVRPPITDANVLELTPELKRKAQREGFPLYILPALGGGAEAIRRMLAEDREERA